MIRFLMLMLSVQAFPTPYDKPPSLSYRIASTITETQVVVGVLIGGISMLVMVLVLVDLMTFSYAHHKRQKRLVSQLTDIVTELAALHDCQYLQKNGELPPRVKAAVTEDMQKNCANKHEL